LRPNSKTELCQAETKPDPSFLMGRFKQTASPPHVGALKKSSTFIHLLEVVTTSLPLAKSARLDGFVFYYHKKNDFEVHTLFLCSLYARAPN